MSFWRFVILTSGMLTPRLYFTVMKLVLKLASPSIVYLQELKEQTDKNDQVKLGIELSWKNVCPPS